MKKLTLFLVAIFAMVNVANAQRAWAYDLELTPSVDSYTFAFKAVTAGDATLVFYKEGVEAGTLDLGSVSAGDNTVTKTSEELLGVIQQSGDFTWGVKMSAGAIAAGSTLKEVTDQTRGIYDFYNMMDVLVDNNPESDYFGKIYIQMALNGASDGATARSKAQKAGLFIYDQELNELNPTSNVGIMPTLPSGYTLGSGGRDKFHRLEIDPKTGNLVYCYNIANSPAVFSINRANPTGLVTNLIDGISGFTRTCAHCFDAEGTLYVMDLASSKGTIYKVVDGQKTAFSETTGKWVNASMSLASDGRGGLWVSQNRGQIDTYYQLVHYNASGTVDFTIYDDLGTYVAATKDNPGKLGTSSLGWLGSSSRGALAYDAERHILAQGRNGAVELFNVTYNASGVPTLTKFAVTPTVGSNIDGLHFDYAGDLYVVNSSNEKFQKFVVPTNNNTCTTPAKKSQVITLVSATPEHTVTISVNGNGTVTGANTGTYLEGTELTLTATPAEHYEFVNWTGDVNSTENPLTVAVNSDMTITANFEKQKHILTVFVNDENKGTIDVTTGYHEYGTEVTLTATPKPGYKLLYWSDRSTENPRTITMTKNEAISAYFVKEYTEEPTFKIEKMWENTNVLGTENGYQGAGWDEKIYVKERGNDKITVYLDATTSEDYAQTDNADDQSIAVDDAGNLVLRSGSANFYGAPKQIILYKKDETTYKTIDFTLPETDRCDFISASGDLFSAEGGYVYFYCQNQTTVSRLHIKNGGASVADISVDMVEDATLTAGSTQSHVFTNIFGNLMTHTRASVKVLQEVNVVTGAVTTMNLPNFKESTLGGCSFELGGKEFIAYNIAGTDYNSEWNLYNMTDKKFVSNETLFTKDKVSKNTAANWLNVQVVDEKTAYIYQFCPKVGVALWKVSFQENYIVSASATNGTVTGAGTYQEGATATLTATPNTGYKFVNWTKGGETITDNPYTFTVSDNVALVANFEAIASKDPRAWAYDMKLGEDGDNYTFTFNATTAGQATISFKDKDGNALAQPESQTKTAVAGENKFTIAKSAFAAGVDAFWSITMDGAPIEGVVEVTDQSRGIYDFYNMMGVVVDNNTDSKDFGKIYIQQSYERSYASSSTSNNGITTRANNQTSGIFIYNQELDELNSPSNVGLKPTMPADYTEIGSSSSAFQRLNIDPKTGNLVFSHAVLDKPAVFAINRDDMTGDVTNLLTGVADMTRSVAHCFDVDGTLFVMNFADNKGTIYKVVNGEATKFTETSGRFINANITIASDGRGGFWISQNRGQIDYYYQLAHVTSAGAIDWSVYDDHGTYVAPQGDNPGKLGTSSLGWLGSSSRGALAYDAERNILAQGRNGKVELYSVSYEPTITLTPLHTIASNGLGNNIDGLAFDYAGDLYVVNSSKEKFQKFTLPTADNICTVAAPALEAVRFTPVYTVSVASNNNEWGIANGGGTFEEGQNATITAVAATNYKFVNWTKDEEIVSTETTYTFAVTESATYVANFEEITKYTINVTYDNTMGTVTGVGSYYEGTEVTLTATAKGGYVFVDWSDGNTDETRTIEVTSDLNLTANFKVAVPRAWAYDLRKGEDGENYTFTFKTTSAGTATLIFKDKDGNTQDFGAHTATANAAEEQTITIAKTVFAAATKDIYWEVELAGEAIAKMAELTNASESIYKFYMPQDVKVDNSPNSMYFGQIYVAAAQDGACRGGNQKRGIFVYNQTLDELNTSNEGYLPVNATLTNTTRQAIHRLAVNPVNGNVAFAYNVSGSSAVWSMNPANLSGNAINLIDNSITAANSICFDKDGALYVMDNANAGSIGGQIYKEDENGKLKLFAAHNKDFQWANADNALAPDGRGGLWIAQNRWALDTYPVLTHVNANGIVDFAVTSASSDELKAMFPFDNATSVSYRGHCAYYVEDDILAFGGYNQVALFKVTYDGAGKPTITEKLMTTPELGTNIDGVAFDYAGDLYVASATAERFYKFVVPTTDNTCTVPAPESQIIMKEARYTVTVVAAPAEMGTVTEGGEYKAGEKVTLTATANTDYRFINWTIGSDVISTDASFEYTVPAENVTITAHFELKPLAMVGVVKRAVQIGESTVVLTHDNGTPHLYKVVDGELEAEISQEGVIARDPDNAGDYLSISDIAVTEDGKLVACNYILCQNEDGNVDDGYKRGESKFYIWENLTSKPSIWFTSKMTSNWFRSKQGYTMAVKGTSQNAQIFTTGANGTNGRTRFSWYHIIDGVFEEPAVNTNDYYHFHNGPDNIHATGNSLEKLVGTQYELNASPLEADRWIMDGNLVEPYEYVLPATNNVALTEGTALATDLGKKFNGATYLTVLGKHLMVAPYADGANVAGVTVLDITNGLNQAEDIDYAELTTPLAATAAATAVKVNGDDLTITLVVDNQIHVFTIDLNLQYTRTVTNGRYGTICLPYGSRNMTGAIFYEVAWINKSTMRVFVDEVTELEAGKPYIFMATSNLIKVVYQGEEANSAGYHNGLYGTFTDINDGPAGTAGNILEDNYMLSNNQIIKCLGNCKLPAYRAYIKLDEISTTEPALMPGRRRVALDVQGGNEATGVDNLTEDGVVPAMEGTYDVLGRKMNEPNNTGFYIVNGKKVVIVK